MNKEQISVTIVENIGWIKDLVSDPKFNFIGSTVPKYIQVIKVTDEDWEVLKKHSADQQIRSQPTLNLWMVKSRTDIPKGKITLRTYEFESKNKSKIGFEFVSSEALEIAEQNLEKGKYMKKLPNLIEI